MWFSIAIFIVALFAVIKSADWFLAAAEKIGTYFKLPRFIMGVVLIGFGTSLPELSTSISAIIAGDNDIVLANIIGSNIANILLVIGISTLLIGTIRVKKDIVDIDLPILLATTALFIFLAFDGSVGRLDAVLLLAGFVFYIFYSLFYKDTGDFHRGFVPLLRTVFSSSSSSSPQKTTATKPSAIVYLQLFASVGLLGAASYFAIESLESIVQSIGIAVSVLSFFALAIGTSLPELTVSFKALRKGQGDLVLGNIVGSSMFNLLLIGGVAGVLSPQNLPLDAGLIMLGALATATLLLTISGITKRLQVWEGITYILLYIAISIQLLA